MIFCQNDAQEDAAHEMIGVLDATGAFPAPVVTEVAGPAPFYAAEDYHQDYFARHPGQGYCQFVVAPKLAKFRQKFGPGR